MESYETLILKTLLGNTPKQNYEKLMRVLEITQIIAFPKYGTDEIDWDIFKAAGIIQRESLVDAYKNYKLL